ncbi:TetR/AcrR family transcriptional regulator [Streptomyces paludis]|uniref:TetR/AcrR family transcriptional regulator n=1 Tax=Streptomyces paludis TaxID=2282738 RepID=A0A345HMI8_9ACTN|nr:TetR/AcrR family transcriptional regulator C-terminal domain-containing protein [Streptomyces paludis]AXG77912.1 TetR/AcrR family transcriptional regulator [Streptomyces paludis]
MPAEQPRAKPVGRPPHLSLDAIIAAADRILQTEGAGKLSMRRLADELNSAPMALYYHVRNKDELLLLVMENQARNTPRPELPEDPRERLIAVSTTLYELLADRLWIIQVLAGDDLMAPSALWFVEEMIGAAVDYGHTPEQAVYIYRTIWYSIVGDLIIRVNGKHRRSRATGPTYEDQVVAGLGSGTHPHLTSVADRWADLNARDTHRQGLAAIIDGLLRSDTTTQDR